MSPRSSVTGGFPAWRLFFTEEPGRTPGDTPGFTATTSGLGIALAAGHIDLRVLESEASGSLGAGGDPLGASRATGSFRLRFDGANPAVPRGRGELPFPSHTFLGAAPSGWRVGVRSYNEVIYESLYDGIDLVFTLSDSGLKYAFLVAPFADSTTIRVHVEGAIPILAERGDLVLRTEAGDIVDAAPFAFQDRRSGRASVPVAYVVEGHTVRFALGPYDPTDTLVLDPYVYSTLLGDRSLGRALAVDASGYAYVAGFTLSLDTFVAKVSPDGRTLVYFTILGGGSEDIPGGIAVDSFGNAYVTGSTWSTDFPVTPGAYQPFRRGLNQDAFVTKIAPDGASLVYSTYLGGDTFDTGYAVAVDSAGNAHIAGETWSWNFPAMAGSFDTSFGDSLVDGFASKLSSDGSSLVYSTFLGGAGEDHAYGVAVDSAGNAYYTGGGSSGFPWTAGAYDTTHNGATDAFVVKLPPAGDLPTYATFVGGTGWEFARGIAVDASGRAVIVGETTSADLPVTANAFDATCGADGQCDLDPGGAGTLNDAFLVEISGGGDLLLFGSYVGGVGNDVAYGVAIDASGHAFVGGWTSAADFPTSTGAVQDVLGEPYDAFLLKADPAVGSLVYATYLGGNSGDAAWAVAVDPAGAAYLTGDTSSAVFITTPGAFDRNVISPEAFLVKIDPVPTPIPIARFARSLSDPSVGEAITFDASESVDPDGRVVSYAWDFGDGSTASGRRVTHAYALEGMFIVTLVVTDYLGDSGIGAAELFVSPRLVPFEHATGFRMPVPQTWQKEVDSRRDDTVIELIVTGPTYDSVPTTLVGDTDFDVTVRETESYLTSTAEAVVGEIQSARPDANLVESIMVRVVGGHAAVAFTLFFASTSVEQELVIVVSDPHDRFWILGLTVHASYFDRVDIMFERILAGFEVTLPLPGLPPTVWVAIVIGVASGGSTVAILLLVLRRRGRQVAPLSPAVVHPAGAASTACPRCGSPVPIGALFCGRCGESVRPGPPRT